MPAAPMVTVSVDPGFPACRVCGWAALPGSSLCVGCLDIREWSRVNRAFCDLLHRPRALGADAVPEALEAEADLVLTA